MQRGIGNIQSNKLEEITDDYNLITMSIKKIIKCNNNKETLFYMISYKISLTTKTVKMKK